jgi:hypothetical protein
MVSKSNQEQLRNKFLDVEMSLEDSEIKYKISKDNIEKIKTVKKTEVPVLYLYSNFFLRASKITLNFLASGIRFVWVEILYPMLKELQKTFIYSLRKFSNLKEQGEVSVETYLSKAESELIAAREVIKMNSQRLNSISGNYIQKLKYLFEGVKNNVEFICNKNELEKVNASLEFDISLYEGIVLKLSSSKMITNVSRVEINSIIDEKNVTNKIILDLKVSGEKWSMLFSKHITSDVFSKIEGYKGKVNSQHIFDPVLKRDKFIFIFIHQRLDFFMDSAKEEKISKKFINISSNNQIDV